jgi:predicted O-methyltransferase YrrM
VGEAGPAGAGESDRTTGARTKELDDVENYLSDVLGITGSTRAGRNVRDGYARGWGLEFGNLHDRVAADPLYRAAVELAAGRSYVSEPRRMNLFLLIKFFLPTLGRGHLIEFGAYKGGNAMFMARVAQEVLPGAQVYALDTFSGMPPTDKTVDAHNAGDFGDVDVNDLRRSIARMGLGNLHVVQGQFEESGPALIATAGPFALAHIDCDIYSAVAFAYDVVRPAMVPGGYIVFDDATEGSCIGATEAVETLVIRRDGLNSEQIHPHFVFRA